MRCHFVEIAEDCFTLSLLSMEADMILPLQSEYHRATQAREAKTASAIAARVRMAMLHAHLLQEYATCQQFRKRFYFGVL
jgi:hypothetical protein